MVFDASKFELNAIKKEWKSFWLVDAGTYIGKCVQVIDLGTTEKEWKNQKTGEPEMYESRSICIRFAFAATQTKKDDDGAVEEIEESEVLLMKTYSLSMSTQSALYKDIMPWLGKLTDEEAKEFNVFTLIGRDAMITVSHKAAKNDKTKIYANISSIAALPKGTPTYKNEVDLDGSIMDEDHFNEDLFETLPPFLKEDAVTSKEYMAMFGATSLAADEIAIEEEIKKNKEVQASTEEVSTEEAEDIFAKKDDKEMK